LFEGEEMLAEIVFVLDETGSMGRIREDTIGSFNNFVEEQKGVEGEATMTLVEFSSTPDEDNFRLQYEGVPLKEVEPLAHDTYRPRGFTPLLDAIGSTIDSVSARLERTEEEKQPDLVIVAVLTDGLENASSEYTLEQVKAKVEHQESEGWKFIFLGANMDAVQVGGDMGFAAARSFDASKEGVVRAYAATSSFVTRARRGKGDTGKRE
jgi:uncharacterized protein YegL